ncbi:centriolin-like [Cucurbita maxima]|uniref:Centriolin-like n=1 Tax=Cucurbita maxima TaxID=3661 RepID=A0A6J1IUW5_CUCMA|nr:centriolin-like [Cucurbita maxima]
MDLPPEIDNYIKETIDHSLGLPVSAETLELKLRVSEDDQRRLDQYCDVLQSKIKEKDLLIERSRAEATMNAQALKKFVEENRKLATECLFLTGQCEKWERECSLYDHDRDALMEFGNEADQRAREAENRFHELQEEVRRLSDELLFFKHEYEMKRVDSSSDGRDLEDNLLELVLPTCNCNDRSTAAHAFLEANSDQDSSQKLIKMWNCLKPSTQKALSLAAYVKAVEKDCEHLRENLQKAEEEVKLLYEDNMLLDEENKRLLKRHQEDIIQHSGDKQQANSGSAAKSNKRKSCRKMSSPIEGKNIINEVDSIRQPLSPLQHNSPSSRMRKK